LFGKLLGSLSERVKDIEINNQGYFDVEVKKDKKKKQNVNNPKPEMQ